MRSLKHQILGLLITSLILLAASFILILGWHMKERAISAAIIKAETDLATCKEIINLKYPGHWQIIDGELYKGEVRINNHNELVDHLAKLTGNTITIFLNDTRVATTVRDNHAQRAIGSKVSDEVAHTVLKNGAIYIGEANVVGHKYQTAYSPIRNEKGNIIGMLYVGISRAYTEEMINNSLKQTAALGIILTIIVGFLAWLLAEKVWIRPLRNITLSTRDLATGHTTERIKVSGPQEIGELATAFNQMIERLEDVAKSFEDHASNAEEIAEKEKVEKQDRDIDRHKENYKPEDKDLDHISYLLKDTSNDYVNNYVENKKDNLLTNICLEQLPKGLNKNTLQQIYEYMMELDSPSSAEQVADGVKLTRVTVRRYLEFLEDCDILKSELKYGTVGRPVRRWFRNGGL